MSSLRADEIRPDTPIRHGAYVCLTVPAAALPSLSVTDVACGLGLVNEFDPSDVEPSASIGYLRRISATPADMLDERLLSADAIVHVSASTPEPVTRFVAELARLLPEDLSPYVLAGVVRPMTYTSTAMFNFAYAHRVLPQPGATMPNAFLLPIRKSEQWWAKDWMARHTYFLPRYDRQGRMLAEGHALAAAGGIDCLLRRTYKNSREPAPEGEYDFLTYFECADADVPSFHAVCTALRDVERNPEWEYVAEGPLWHGRRVASWAELWQ
jgi:hypothetical protein